MARTVVLERLRLSPDYWSGIVNSQAAIDEIAQMFHNNHIFRSGSYGYGFARCTVVGDTVVGYFVHEGTRTDTDYDANSNQIELPTTPFAHIVFSFVISTGDVGLQSTKILDFVDLNLSQMRSAFPNAILEMMGLAKVPVLRLTLERHSVQLSPDQLYDFYHKYRTTEIKITNLAGRVAPSYEDFKIFNPRVNDDLIFRQVFQEDTQKGLNSMDLETRDNADLRDIATAKLGARMGDVKAIKVFVDNNNRNFILTTGASRKFRVSVKSENETESFSESDVMLIRRLLTVNLENIEQTLVDNAKQDANEPSLFSFIDDDNEDE